MKRPTRAEKKGKGRFKPSGKPSKPVKRAARGRFAPGTAPGPGRPRAGEEAKDYAEAAIPAEEGWKVLAKLIRRGSLGAVNSYLDRRHGRPWTEAEIIAQREIEDAERRIEAARRGEKHHGTIAAPEGGEITGEGGQHESPA